MNDTSKSARRGLPRVMTEGYRVVSARIPDAYTTPTDAARILGVSPAKLTNWLAHGVLEIVEVPVTARLLDLAAVERLAVELEAQTEGRI